MRNLRRWFALALLLAARPVGAQQPGWNKGFDALMDSIRIRWKIPGMAIAVV